jgi:two-component system cell cycle sensor histidine kinase/response regulator CckA
MLKVAVERQLPYWEVMREPQKILVVDDDAMILRFVGITLKRQGYAVHQASSGDEALQYFTDHGRGVAMVLTDVIMPGMSGPQMIERILAVQPDLPVMFMTGTAADARLPRAQTRRYKLLHKPFTPQKLLDYIRDCLDAGEP